MPKPKKDINKRDSQTKVLTGKNGKFLEPFNALKHVGQVPEEVPYNTFKRHKSTNVVYNPKQPNICHKYKPILHDEKIQKGELIKDTIAWGQYRDNKGFKVVSFAVEGKKEVCFRYDESWHKDIEPTFVTQTMQQHRKPIAMYLGSDGKPYQVKIDENEFEFKDDQLPTLKANSQFQGKKIKIVPKSTYAYAKKKFANMQKKQKVNTTTDQQTSQSSLPAVVETHQSGNNPLVYTTKIGTTSTLFGSTPAMQQEDNNKGNKHSVSYLLN